VETSGVQWHDVLTAVHVVSDMGDGDNMQEVIYQQIFTIIPTTFALTTCNYPAVSSMKIPSLSSCINSSPPHKYSRIKYSFPPVWNA